MYIFIVRYSVFYLIVDACMSVDYILLRFGHIIRVYYVLSRCVYSQFLYNMSPFFFVQLKKRKKFGKTYVLSATACVKAVACLALFFARMAPP